MTFQLKADSGKLLFKSDHAIIEDLVDEKVSNHVQICKLLTKLKVQIQHNQYNVVKIVVSDKYVFSDFNYNCVIPLSDFNYGPLYLMTFYPSK